MWGKILQHVHNKGSNRHFLVSDRHYSRKDYAMGLFEIHTENRWEDFIWGQEVPQSYQGILLCGSEPHVLTGDFGSMLFQHAAAPKYNIWLSDYDLASSRTFTARLDFVTTELSMVISNNLFCQLLPVGQIDLRETQFNITHAPFMENRVRLNGLEHYTTFDIHFQLSYFEKLSFKYPDEILPFLDKIGPGRHATFYDRSPYATSMMLMLAREILRVLSQQLTDRFKLDLLVELLCIEAITCFKKPRSSSQLILARERDMIRHITSFILSDTSYILTIDELARKAGMNSKKLKYLFKKENGTGIYRYWLYHRLEQSRELLIRDPRLTLNEVAHIFGFSDAHSFSKAFRKRYNTSPSDFRKRY